MVKPKLEGVYSYVITGDIFLVCNSFIVSHWSKKNQRRISSKEKFRYLGLDWIFNGLDHTQTQVAKCDSFLDRQISPTSNLQANCLKLHRLQSTHIVQLIFLNCSNMFGTFRCRSVFRNWTLINSPLCGYLVLNPIWLKWM